MRIPGSVLLVLLAACDSATGPGGPTLQLTGSIVFGIPTLATTATAKAGGIDVTGVFPTPSAEFSLVGKITAAEGSLRLDIDAFNNRPGAPFPVQNYYVGRIRNLPAGTYELVVFETLHTETGLHSAMALRDSVQVP